MHFHPKDTYEAFKPVNKEKISHLWYQLHYNIMGTDKGKYVIKKRQSAPLISQELLQLAENVEKQRMQAFAELSDHYFIRHLKGTPLSRFIHGLGGANVRETSLTLHPVYGVPFIPSSSVKGIVRNWFIQAYCDGNEAALDENKWGRFVFGTQENRGAVQFHDILLYKGLNIEADILTVHFNNYYSGKKPATDYGHKINPVLFWTVNVNEANIFLTMKKGREIELPAKDILNAVVAWTIQAFKEFGIGAKTSLGYGLFKEVKDNSNEELKQLIAKKQEKKTQQFREQQKKLQQEKEMREQQELAAQLEKMPKEKRLVYEINSLSESEDDQNRSKSILYQEVIEQQNREAAAALKVYWEKTGQWAVKKKQKKQYNRVQELKKLLQS